MAESLAASSAYPVVIEATETLDNLVKRMSNQDEVAYIAILSADGRVLATTSSHEGGGDLSKEADQKAIMMGDQPSTFPVTSKTGKKFYEAVVPIFLKAGYDDINERIGTVRVGLSLSDLQQKLKGILWIGFLITGVIMAGGILAVFVFVYVVTSPLKRMASIAARIAEGDFSQRIKVTSQDEIGLLGASFNRMAEKIEEAIGWLRNLNEELEQRVRERTAELAEKNTELQKAMTYLQETQAQLLQSEKMAAVGKLAGGIAHEINNPLCVILGFAQSLVKQLSDTDPQALPLRSMEREAKRCKYLVQNFLAFSRSSKGEKIKTEVNLVVEEALELIRHQTAVKKIELRQEMASGLPPILADKNQLQQVLINLATNAMDAMPTGGDLTFATMRGSHGDGRDWVEIQVRDTGCGIPKEVHSKIFEPFWTTKEVGKGTGLGLSLCYEIAQRHGGSISVESETGKGTTFMVRLPAAGNGTRNNGDEKNPSGG